MGGPEGGSGRRWETCAVEGCGGARLGADGKCLAHLGTDRLETVLARLARGGPLDGRGVHIDGELLGRIVAAATADDVGHRRLRRARFDGARFSGDVSFDGVAFEHDVSFDRARFDGDASFRGAAFRCHARFARTTFRMADFREATFEGQAWFPAATFADDSSFERVSFGTHAWFPAVAFAADVAFDDALFAADASFDGTSFGCHTRFLRARFEGDLRLADATFAHEPRYDGAVFRGKGGAPQTAVRQAIWSGAALAPWGRRVVAAAVDVAIPVALIAASVVIALVLGALHYEGVLPVMVVAGVAAGLFVAVRNLVDQGRSGQSVGKRRLGLCLVRQRDGRPVGAWRSITRHILHLLDLAPAGLGLLWPLWDKKHQTFADKILTTVVIVRSGWSRPSSAGVATEQPVGAGFS